VAENPNTPVTVLNKLAQDKNWRLKAAVARNPSTPNSLLDKLAKERHWEIRSSVAANTNTSPRILNDLAVDNKFEVRAKVAVNPKADIGVLATLWGYEKNHGYDHDLLYRISKNTNCPTWLKAAITTVSQ
jgi:hypothetical protein